MSTKFYPAKDLTGFCRAALESCGLPAEDAYTVADSLVTANLRGVDSHGVARMGIYVRRLLKELINPLPEISVARESEATLLVDGDNGMGQVVAQRALEMGLRKVKRSGSVSLGVSNSNHYGAGAYYVQQAVEEDIISFIYSNAPSTMAPWGGVDPYLGTNPYACGLPAGKYEPIVVDMATSVVARGKVILAAEKGESIPEGWAIDKMGETTTDAAEALEGSVLPFGGPKGYAISLMIDVMAGVLTGAGFGPRVGDLYKNFDKPQNVGAFFSLLDINSFMPVAEFKERVDLMIGEIKAARRAAGTDEIFLPGEIESQNARRRQAEGIPLDSSTEDLLEEVGRMCNVPM